jgi:Ca2+-binding EF-hand superfamily protein
MTRISRIATLALLIPALAAGSPLFAQAAGQSPGRAQDPFESADTNHDGSITREEYRAARQAQFDAMDRNKDGVLNIQDFPEAANDPRVKERLDAMLSSADTNHDGSVSREELAKAPMPFFDRVDTDHNGTISPAELAAFRAAMQERRGR